MALLTLSEPLIKERQTIQEPIFEESDFNDYEPYLFEADEKSFPSVESEPADSFEPVDFYDSTPLASGFGGNVANIDYLVDVEDEAKINSVFTPELIMQEFDDKLAVVNEVKEQTDFLEPEPSFEVAEPELADSEVIQEQTKKTTAINPAFLIGGAVLLYNILKK